MAIKFPTKIVGACFELHNRTTHKAKDGMFWNWPHKSYVVFKLAQMQRTGYYHRMARFRHATSGRETSICRALWPNETPALWKPAVMLDRCGIKVLKEPARKHKMTM